MGKKSKKAKRSGKSKDRSRQLPPSAAVAQDDVSKSKPKMKAKEYEREMRRLQGELVALQEWVKASGAKVCIVFEGLDSAGKGGTIRRITERTSPRVFKHIALPAPNEREKSQMYIQRYMAHFPAAGEVAIFDRSWYNRAGVEPVMGYCTPEQTQRFLDMAPAVEKAMVDNEIILIDEVMTPDSSRFWPEDQYEAGRGQASYDKQYVRDWLEQSGWDKNSPPPVLPDDVVQQTSRRYIEAYEQLTGLPFRSL